MTTTASPTSGDLAVLGATTVSYYLVDDLVSRPWLRRLLRAAVLTGAAAATVGRTGVVSLGVGQSAHAGGDVRATTERVTPDSTGHGDAGQPTSPGRGIMSSPRALAGAAAAGLGLVGAGAWINSRIDRGATGIITRVGGRIPLFGGLLRRFPSTTWGVMQVGLVLGTERLNRPDKDVR